MIQAAKTLRSVLTDQKGKQKHPKLLSEGTLVLEIEYKQKLNIELEILSDQPKTKTNYANTIVLKWDWHVFLTYLVLFFRSSMKMASLVTMRYVRLYITKWQISLNTVLRNRVSKEEYTIS